MRHISLLLQFVVGLTFKFHRLTGLVGEGGVTQTFVGFDISSWEILGRVLRLFDQQLVASERF